MTLSCYCPLCKTNMIIYDGVTAEFICKKDESCCRVCLKKSDNHSIAECEDLFSNNYY